MDGGARRCDRDAYRETQKKQRNYYSGKKKCHTLKSQVLVDASNYRILATAHAKGSKHDYALFKDTAPRCQPEVWYVADSGYQGLASRHPQTCLPVKKPESKELNTEQKAHNRALGRFRIAVEHTIRSVEIWRILKETYRNRRKRFALRFNLIAGLINAGLDS